MPMPSKSNKINSAAIKDPLIEIVPLVHTLHIDRDELKRNIYYIFIFIV